MLFLEKGFEMFLCCLRFCREGSEEWGGFDVFWFFEGDKGWFGGFLRGGWENLG